MEGPTDQQPTTSSPSILAMLTAATPFQRRSLALKQLTSALPAAVQASSADLLRSVGAEDLLLSLKKGNVTRLLLIRAQAAGRASVMYVLMLHVRCLLLVAAGAQASAHLLAGKRRACGGCCRGPLPHRACERLACAFAAAARCVDGRDAR